MKTDSPLQSHLATVGLAVVLLWLFELVLSIALAAVLAWPFKWLWNWAVVPIVGISGITFAQGFGLLLLSKLVRVVIDGVKTKATLRTDGT